jgi:hypothetical protein
MLESATRGIRPALVFLYHPWCLGSGRSARLLLVHMRSPLAGSICTTYSTLSTTLSHFCAGRHMRSITRNASSVSREKQSPARIGAIRHSDCERSEAISQRYRADRAGDCFAPFAMIPNRMDPKHQDRYTRSYIPAAPAAATCRAASPTPSAARTSPCWSCRRSRSRSHR